MLIRKIQESDYNRVMEIWATAVKTTHHFLSEQDFNYFREVIPAQYLPGLELYLACPENKPAGFIGLSHPEDAGAPPMVEMLFVDPALHRQGIGSALLDFVRAKYPVLLLDVNEQNPGALAFYQRYGFKQTGRSELDASGKPYPLLHMRFER